MQRRTCWPVAVAAGTHQCVHPSPRQANPGLLRQGAFASVASISNLRAVNAPAASAVELKFFEAAHVSNPFEQNLDKNPANYQQLTPLSFLARTAVAAPEHIAIIHGNARVSYAEFYKRCRQLASALSARGIGRGDTVSVMLANTPAMLEAHFGVAMTGAVRHTINTRLDAAVVAFQLDHAATKLLLTDREFAGTMKAALALAKAQPIVIDYDDPEFPQTGEALSDDDYEAFVSNGDPNFEWRWPEDEWEAISLNYTSGTTGNPKRLSIIIAARR